MCFLVEASPGMWKAKRPRRLPWKMVKNLAEAEDSLSEVASKNFQRLLRHSLDDLAIRFEMDMMRMCKPTVGAVAMVMRVVRSWIDSPTLSWGSSSTDPCTSWQCLWMPRRHARACRVITFSWDTAWSRLSELVKPQLPLHQASQNSTCWTLNVLL